MAEYNLLEKTELTIRGILLKNVDLDKVARAAADTFGIDRGDLFVTDVQGDHLVFDILKKDLDPHALVGKRDELLRRLGGLPGIEVTDETTVSSRGMLGWIALGAAEGKRALRTSERMAREIRQRLKKRAVVFSTGAEMVSGQVRDTNAVTIRERLCPEGYSVRFGSTLKDDEALIAAHLRRAADDGYGLVIVTGGVGAEDKDRTIEAVLLVDPEAVTPQIVKFQLGVGRHRHKDCVRIAIGKLFETLIVALPGPNDEVKLGLEALVKGLASNLSKEDLGEGIAVILRERLRDKVWTHSTRRTTHE